jgi:hypothetical protein
MMTFRSILKISWGRTIFLGFTSLLAIYIIFKTTVSVRNFSEIINQIDNRYFWLAFAVIPPSIFLNAVRWHYVLKASGYIIKFKRVFMIATGSLPFCIIPGRLGDFVRSYPLRNEIPVSQTIATIILEKIIDICTLFLYAGIGLLLIGYYWGSAIALLISFATIPCLIILKKSGILPETENKMIKKIFDAAKILDRIHERKNFLYMAVLSSIVNMGLSLVGFYWLMTAVHAQVPIIAIFAFMPLCIIIGLLPLTLAGMGTRDAALIYFFSPYALASQSLSAGLVYALQGYWSVAILCLPFLFIFFKDES